MNPASFQELYDYTFWADRLVWTCVEQISEDAFNQNPGDSDSIREQCIHTMAVEWWWPHFLATGTLDFLDPDDYPTRAAIRARWDEVEGGVRGYLETLTASELEREVRPAVWDESRRPIRVWQALLQVANHSTDHRAQILASIRSVGGPTVEQDYLTYLFERQATAGPETNPVVP